MASTDEPFERRILAALRRIVHAIDLHSRQLMSQCEVTTPQLVCLHMLSLEGRLTSKSLAEKIRINASTLVGILDRLEAKGLVARERSQEDRRSVFVTLTNEGVAFVAKAPSPLHSALVDGLRRLSSADQERLAASLEEIVGLMQADQLDEVPVLAASRYGRRVDKSESGAPELSQDQGERR
ncbi:MAG: MarR family transcriptional regulator [Planctomycetes bacterium]|nr:MarR family transcriptional regulator [Planctomycetota bacterium]